MQLIKLVNRRFSHCLLLSFCSLLIVRIANADPVVVTIDDGTYVHQPTDTSKITHDAGDYSLLVIPVVSADTAYDVNNNSLNSWIPGLYADIVSEWITTKEYWLNETHGEITIDADVLPRYFPMPEPKEFYFNPRFQPVFLQAGTALALNPAVPEGDLVLRFDRSTTSSVDLTISFDAAAASLGRMALVSDIESKIESLVGDQINVGINGGLLKFEVDNRFVNEGTTITVDDTSDFDVVDALSLTAFERNTATGTVISSGAELPIVATTDTVMTFTADYDGVATETVSYTLPAGTYTTASALQSALVTTAGSSVSISGSELAYMLDYPNPSDVTSISANVATGLLSTDQLGLDEATSTLGVVRESKQNTVKGDRRVIAGQAIAAYMIDELTSATPGAPDTIPDIAFTSGNSAALRVAFTDHIDPYHSIVVLFLDADKRGGASGSWLPIRIQNGSFVFDHTSVADLQIYYEADPETVALHETGHNIGFPDIYNNGNGNYDPQLLYPNQWEQMANQREYPSVGGYLRSIYSDWLTRTGGNIATFREPTVPSSTQTRRYVLTPVESDPTEHDDLIGVPAGRTLAKIIKLPLATNPSDERHSLLIQNRQEYSHVDSDYPPIDQTQNGGVYITDTITPDLFEYFLTPTRNYAHPLTNWPPIGPYSDVDRRSVEPLVDRAPATDIDLSASYPAYDGITVDIVGEIPGPDGKPAKLIDVSREQADYLDLAITPWGAPPWQSVDIWIEHGDKSPTELSTVPLANNGEETRWAVGYDQTANGGDPLNWVRVKISNNGTVDATDVQLDVRVNSPGGLGASGDWDPLPSSQRHDIPAGGSAIFDIPWNPSVDEHTCIKVQIFRWNAPVGELDFTNNQTQENVVDFQAVAASPWQPAKFEFDIANPFIESMPVELVAENLPYGMVVDFEKSFIEIPPNSTIRSGGTLRIDSTVIEPPIPSGAGDLFWTVPKLPVVSGSVTLPEKKGNNDQPERGKPIKVPIHIGAFAIVDGHSRVPIGGITLNTSLQLESVLRLNVKESGNEQIVVSGTTEPAAGHTRGTVLVTYPTGRITFVPVKFDAQGRFTIRTKAVDKGNVIVSARSSQRGQFHLVSKNAFKLDPRSGQFEEIAPPE